MSIWTIFLASWVAHTPLASWRWSLLRNQAQKASCLILHEAAHCWLAVPCLGEVPPVHCWLWNVTRQQMALLRLEFMVSTLDCDEYFSFLLDRKYYNNNSPRRHLTWSSKYSIQQSSGHHPLSPLVSQRLLGGITEPKWRDPEMLQRGAALSSLSPLYR